MKAKRSACIMIIVIMMFTAICPAIESYADSDTKYWLKVNTQANVVNVYKKKDGEWKPHRVMLCSTGINGTPLGTYYIKNRWDWGALVDNVYGRYCVHIFGDYLFHSVPYEKKYDKKSMPTKEFNKLGKDASHGCVRLSVMDAKWVYRNCRKGTKVTIYKSSNPGPLGKPEAIKVRTDKKTYWDPTDNDPKNPQYKIRKAEIKISSSKKLNVKYGSTYNLKSGVTAKDPNTFQNITGWVKVSKVKKYSPAKDEFIDASFSTKKCGTYRITYKVDYPYSGTAYKSIKIKVGHQLKAPVVSISNKAVDGNPRLTWEAVDNATKYVIYKSKTKNGTYTKMYTTKGKAYTNTAGTEPGKTYYYKVKAVSNSEKYIESGFSGIKSCICDLPQPQVSSSVNEQNGKPVLTWEPVEGAGRYIISKASEVDGEYVVVFTQEETSFEDISVLGGEIYYYKVKAVFDNNAEADSAYSEPVMITYGEMIQNTKE